MRNEEITGKTYIEVDDFEGENELIKGLLVFLDVLALGYAVTKFRHPLLIAADRLPAAGQ